MMVVMPLSVKVLEVLSVHYCMLGGDEVDSIEKVQGFDYKSCLICGKMNWNNARWKPQRFLLH